jgi:hypothetical protein
LGSSCGGEAVGADLITPAASVGYREITRAPCRNGRVGMRGLATLNGMLMFTPGKGPQVAFLKVEPRAARPEEPSPSRAGSVVEQWALRKALSDQSSKLDAIVEGSKNEQRLLNEGLGALERLGAAITQLNDGKQKWR